MTMTAMNKDVRAILISAIIGVLNGILIKKNKELCKQNLYTEQVPLHGADTFFRLSFMADDQIRKIAATCGI